MAEKVNLKVMQCPTCGGALKAVNGTDEIICVWCGNSIVPVQEAPAGGQNSAAGMGGGLVKIEGMRTPASALAYAEQFFEEYDWDAFNYAQSLSINVIDRLVGSMKGACADDKNTWILCSKAITVPVIHKVEGCQQILKIVIAQYKQDNLDAYSTFDAYKRVSAMIRNQKDRLMGELEKIAVNAKKYGATDEDLKNLSADWLQVKNLPDLPEYNDIKQIPEIKEFIAEQNAQIVAALATKGINAGEAYTKAKNLIAQNNYVEALNTLRSLKGYADTEDLIAKIDKYFLMSDALEIGGKLYFFRLAKSGQELNLHPTANGEILDKPILKNIKQVITNYADILYYLDNGFKLKKYNFSTNTEEKLYKKRLSDKPIHVRGYTAYLLLQVEPGQNRELVALDLVTGAVQTTIGNVSDIISFNGNKLVYTTVDKGENGISQRITNVVDMEAKKMVSLGSKPVDVAGFLKNYVVFTQDAPNSFNKNLFIKAIDSQEPAKLIERNIYRFCDIISNKLFYYIGNSRNPSLISINCDGTERKEWPLYISRVLFAQGGWLYFIRKAGYNSILCKARIDGSDFCVIAADIDEFVEIKNGYLYYVNDRSDLVKVRMDGSNLQKLCDDVETVLSVKDDKIIFISVDGRITVGTPPFTTTKVVKSIYAVDFTGGGKRKLAYNIGSAKEYDEQTVYYLSAAEDVAGQPDTTYEVMYKLDVASNQSSPLLYITRVAKKSGCYVATCVYGSYDCPQVWTLRRYRDEVLASTWYGRCFIHTYYAISPTLVSWFGDTKWFKKLWQGKLDRMVHKLQQQGVEDTPYEDKAW